MAEGMLIVRLPARDLGGLRRISPPSSSTSCSRTWTVRVSRSMLLRRSAITSPQRRLAKVASNTRASNRRSAIRSASSKTWATVRTGHLGVCSLSAPLIRHGLRALFDGCHQYRPQQAIGLGRGRDGHPVAEKIRAPSADHLDRQLADRDPTERRNDMAFKRRRGAPPYPRPSARPPSGRTAWGPVPDGAGNRAGHRTPAAPYQPNAPAGVAAPPHRCSPTIATAWLDAVRAWGRSTSQGSFLTLAHRATWLIAVRRRTADAQRSLSVAHGGVS